MSRKIGVALSGGGYRAAAFHLGTLRALNRLGLLSKIDVISSVSGGSIIAAYYGLHNDVNFETFEKEFRKGLRKSSLFGYITNLIIIMVIPPILSWLVCSWFLWLYLLLIPLGFTLIPSSKWIEYAYDKIFFKKAKLKDLPDKPIIGINSTNIVNGRLFTFSRQDVGGYDYRNKGKSIIRGEEIPLSFAVSCSTCVPAFFSPRKIKKKYFISGEYRDNLLVDGGIYDNQGAYILSESTNQIFRVENVIVSDAGNSEPKNQWILNTFCLMYQSIEVLMNRIRTMQIRKNIYHKRFEEGNVKPKFAYLSLRWGKLTSMPSRFINNVKMGFVDKVVINHHNITDEEVTRLMNENDEALFKELQEKFEKSIDWHTLLKNAPSEKEYSIAYNVGTNLTPLTYRQMDALSEYADWLTELQIRTYLPYLID